MAAAVLCYINLLNYMNWFIIAGEEGARHPGSPAHLPTGYPASFLLVKHHSPAVFTPGRANLVSQSSPKLGVCTWVGGGWVGEDSRVPWRVRLWRTGQPGLVSKEK